MDNPNPRGPALSAIVRSSNNTLMKFLSVVNLTQKGYLDNSNSVGNLINL